MAEPIVIFGKKPMSERVAGGEDIAIIVAQEAAAVSTRTRGVVNVWVYEVVSSVMRQGGGVEQTYQVRVSAPLETGKHSGLVGILRELGYRTPQLQ